MNIKKKEITVILGTLLCVLLVVSCTPQEEIPVEQAVLPAPIDTSVIAEGMVLPISEAVLAFESGGTIDSIHFEEGDWVRQGDVLVTLANSSQLEAEREALALELLTTQQAQNDLYQNEDSDREHAWQAVLDAQTALNLAQAVYDKLDEDRYDSDLEKAGEAIIDAKQVVDDARDDLTEYLDLDVENVTRKRYEDALARAEDTYNEKVRAKSDLQTQHEQVLSDYKMAQAVFDAAQVEYEKRQAGPDADRMALLEAQIASIEARQQAVTDQLAKMEITAPFDGQVVKVNYEAAEFAGPGQPVLVLADTSHWIIESTDLTEMEVRKLSEGQSVSLEAEAFPGEVFTGTVERIAEYPQMKQGDVLYTVRVGISSEDLPQLYWGMTVTMTFE